jgi:hypothetical protein
MARRHEEVPEIAFGKEGEAGGDGYPADLLKRDGAKHQNGGAGNRGGMAWKSPSIFTSGLSQA